MTHQRAAAVLAFALLVWSVPAFGQSPASIDALQRWVQAVATHIPGRPDAAVAATTAMTYGARVNLNTSYPIFIRILRARDPATAFKKYDKAETDVNELARTVRERFGAQAFLKRAAMLHFDAVIFAGNFPTPPDDAPWTPPAEPSSRAGRALAGPPVPPLLLTEHVTLTRDGQVIGTSYANWNLPFARSLLDELKKQSMFEDRPGEPLDQSDFIGDWYHAVASYLFAKGMNGDATSHLAHAARVLPDDPRALFDRGTYAETLGLPIYQALQGEAASRRGALYARLPPEEKTNAEAEQRYREALAADPAFVEARVRLGRLLAQRGAYDEAAAEIDKALASRPEGVVGYYAHLFAGRIASARGRHTDALRHYVEASSLYPAAQSARVGVSHSAVMAGDVAQGTAVLAYLGDGHAANADPWLDYQIGAGRDVNALVGALWKKMLQ